MAFGRASLSLVRPGRSSVLRPLYYCNGALCFAAFDLLWLDGEDLRSRPLLERKRQQLRELIPRGAERSYSWPSLELRRDVCQSQKCDLSLRAIRVPSLLIGGDMSNAQSTNAAIAANRSAVQFGSMNWR
jgi:hypothetical protein